MTPPHTPPNDLLAQLALLAQSVPYGEQAFTLVMFILVLSVLIFVHEWGHYMAARSVGITVQRFAIGFGRPWVKWVDKQGTQWQIGWIPLGGYVQMLGQEDLKPSKKSSQSGHYMAKSVWQRAWVIVAGPLANLVLGFVLLLAIMLSGEQKLKAEVGSVMPGFPAQGFLMEGDLITGIDGVTMESWDDVLATLTQNKGQQIAVTLEREGDLLGMVLFPKVVEHKDIFGEVHTVGRIGVIPSGATFVVPHGPVSAVVAAANKTYELTALTLKSLWKLLIGAIGADNLTGPLGIANLTGQTATNGFYALAMFMTVISINLFIVNLFPLPVLDGGHLVFLALEKLRGRPLGERAQNYAFQIGLACIVGLFLLSTFNDIKRFGWLGTSQSPPTANAAGTQP
jgi:regulator of sigma E protease